MTSIVAISDLHGYLPSIPECDILVVAGDISPIDYDRDTTRVMNWVKGEFSAWINDAPTKHRLVIAGNHDFVIQKYNDTFHNVANYSGWTYLQDESIELERIKFYGTPWVPNLSRWAFYGDPVKLSEVYKAVPNDTDFVISHGPPFGTKLDQMDSYSYYMGEYIKSIGSQACFEMIERVQPEYFVCGHIHEAYGVDHIGETKAFNVSYCDLDYSPVQPPIVIEL